MYLVDFYVPTFDASETTTGMRILVGACYWSFVEHVHLPRNAVAFAYFPPNDSHYTSGFRSVLTRRRG